MKKNINVIRTKWYGHKQTIEDGTVVAGAVLVFDSNINKFRAYIGVGIYEDEEMDTLDIIDYGNKIDCYEALGIFGNIKYNGFNMIDQENFTM